MSSSETLGEWLARVGLTRLEATFLDNGIDLDVVPLLTDSELKQIGLTLGDRKLENEVLELFEQQAGMLIRRMDEAAPALVAALAHTLSGSASGVGAGRVARAALELELVASGRQRGDIAAANARLCAEVAVTRMVIARRRRSG